MSPRFKQTPLLITIFLLIFLGCRALIPPAPTATPVATSTPVAAPTDPKPRSCNADETLKNLKSKVAYKESALLYNKVQDLSFLAVWFVDPEINPSAKESELTENTEMAIRHALIVSQELNAADPCVSKLFTVINAIVVDKNYNGWLSGQINTTDLPATVQTDEKQLNELAKLYEIGEVGYLRSKVTAKIGSAPAGSCTWPDARKNIHNHFASERENVAFYFVLDDAGINVWAQWDSQPDFVQINLPASLLNIAMEVDCLHPQPDRIMFNVVDETGEIQMIGLWNWSDAKKQDISQIQILYQK
jgi:hypothetical protein